MHALVLVTSGAFVIVYVLGTAAAVRLLPRGSWARRGAVVALLASLALLAIIGAAVLPAVGVGIAAVAYDAWSSRRASRRDRPSDRSLESVPVG
jgi:amino acid efflux transporter